VKLTTFGKVGLEESTFSRPKPLLMLAYLTLEGPQDRRRLTELFWTDKKSKKSGDDKQELQKRLGQLSVVLAQFKKEGAPNVVPDRAGINPIPSQVTCDALEFLEHLQHKKLKEALELYHGAFLQDLGKPLQNLDVSGGLQDWVLEQREKFAEKARSAMLQLAEQAHANGDAREATRWAEKAYAVSAAPELEPAQLSRLQHLLRATKSDVTKKVDKAVKASLDEISPEAREVFLAMSLQTTPNLTVVREALKLSISELSQLREELLFAGLVDEKTVLAKDMARDWLNAHPSERVPLLMKVVRSTPPEEAFELYHSIYQETKGFGGIGDLQKARKAYYLKAKELMDAREFSATIETLSELREVENLHEAEPDGSCRFLEAYALERLGRFKEAFALLQTLPEKLHDPDVTALKSGLLWRLGKSEEARTTAESVIQNGLEWMWARASATNTLGNLCLSSGDFLEAGSHFKKAAALFNAAGTKERWVGCLNNYAIALSNMAAEAKERHEPESILEAKQIDAKRAYHEALDALEQTEDNPLLKARILFNLGSLSKDQGDWLQAEEYYLQAAPLAEKVGFLELAAQLQLNLGHIYRFQQQPVRAKASFTQAIDTATKAGEPFLQGMAIANLAFFNDDPDAMEIALEFLEQSGHVGSHLDNLFETYEAILKRLLKQAHSLRDSLKEQLYKGKLTAFYQRNQLETPGFEVESTLTSSSKPTEVN
jgi:tetratricopeptide (TPR) repeat protein